MRTSSIADLERCFEALADPTRLRMLALLRDGERCVCEVMAHLGLSPSRASRNLNILKEAGLLQDRRQGQWVYYRINRHFPGAEALWAFLDQLLDEGTVGQDRGGLEAPLACCPQGEVRGTPDEGSPQAVAKRPERGTEG